MSLFGQEVEGLLRAGPALLAACVLYLVPLKKRPRFVWRLLGALVPACALLVWEATWIGAGRTLPMAAYFVIFLLMMGITLWCCPLSVREAAYCSACAYLTQHLIYSFLSLRGAGYWLVVSRIDMETVFRLWGTPFFDYAVYLCGYAAAYFLIVKRLPQEGRFHVSSSHSMILLVFTVVSSIVLSHLSTIMIMAGGGIGAFFLCHCYGLLCCVIALWAQIGKARELKRQEKMTSELELRRQQVQQYESYQENVELIRYQCHDLKQQVAMLREMGGGLPGEVLSRVEESVMLYDSYVKTGDEALDTILTERNLWCEKNGISMSCIVDGACLTFMDTVDLFAIFGNALANAIECVSKIDEREKRVIGVKAFVRMDVLFIQFENYFESEVVRNGKLPKSTKPQGGSHGYGLKSILYSVQKYGGDMTIDTEGNLFSLRIAIPLATAGHKS